MFLMIKVGSDLNILASNWPQSDLRQIAAAFQKFVRQEHPFQRLDIDSSLALQMFEDNIFKAEQIPHIASKSSSGRSVTVYRVGTYFYSFSNLLCANFIS